MENNTNENKYEQNRKLKNKRSGEWVPKVVRSGSLLLSSGLRRGSLLLSSIHVVDQTVPMVCHGKEIVDHPPLFRLRPTALHVGPCLRRAV